MSSAMFLIRLQSEIFPKTFNKEDTKYVGCELENGSRGKAHHISEVVFAKVTVRKQNVITELAVVVKMEPVSQPWREITKSDIQFYNEVFMYTQVLPALGHDKLKEPIFPNFHYGIGLTDNSDKNVIILEDLRPMGFQISNESTFLDLNHLSLAMEKLGNFHALSYAAKEQSPVKFSENAFVLKDNFCIKDQKLHKMAKACLHRAIDPLLKELKNADVLQKFIKKVDDDFLKLLQEIVSPTDPLAVICHGDFCRNNILFKYNNGQPTDVRFFDIATSRYASPAIDISFFLFLNTSSDMRRSHWESLLKMYYKGLSYLGESVNIPTLEDIQDAVRQKGVWGFIHCSFFLPLMLFGGKAVEFNEESLVVLNTSRGGAPATKILNDLVEEMLQKNMFELYK